MEPKRENTIKLRFGSHTRNPTNEEVFTFFKEQGWTCDDLSAMYREDYSLFVRFQSDALAKTALGKLGTSVEFQYANGTRVQVAVTTANGTFRYVRIFGLPPEVKDEQIVTVLAKYGTIYQLVRERYPAETGFPIWNGIRGAHMEIVSEIPAQLHIQHIKARVFYDGMQSKCFACGALDHLKANCPNRRSVNARLQSTSGQPNSNLETVPVNGKGNTNDAGSFANVVLNGRMAQPSSGSGMVVLGQQNEAILTVTRGSDKSESLAKNEVVKTTANQGNEDGEDVEMKAEEISKKKRGRESRRKDSDSSESDAVSRKQMIVPSAETSLLLAQAQRSRSLNTRSKTGEKSAK